MNDAKTCFCIGKLPGCKCNGRCACQCTCTDETTKKDWTSFTSIYQIPVVEPQSNKIDIVPVHI